MVTAGLWARRGSARLQCALLAAFTGLAGLLMQSRGLINSDVAFLAWTAREVMGPPVFGVDIYEANLPLAFMIYTPAAILAPLVGFPLAINLWVAALASLSVVMFWQACDERLRLALTATLAVYLALANPAAFGQREHIAMMLTAPYVAGALRGRPLATLSGVMAGIGFAIKPYFLIPLIMVFATRRRIGTEEIAIAATGAVYAATLLLFFQPYLFDFVPLVRATYWATHQVTEATYLVSGLLLVFVLLTSVAGAPQPEARGFLAATIGFTLAAILQFIGFGYHFQAALGFLALYLVARIFNPARVVALTAAIELLVLASLLGFAALGLVTKPSARAEAMRRLLPEIDKAESFLSLSTAPFPGFPTALYTGSAYKGFAIWAIFSKAARDVSGGPELQDRAKRLTFDQAIRELQRQPALVIVDRPASASGWERPEFDLISWFKTDPRFRAAWDDYRYDKSIDHYEFYRRK